MSSFTYTMGALVAAIVIAWIVGSLETVRAGTLRSLTRTNSGRQYDDSSPESTMLATLTKTDSDNTATSNSVIIFET